MRSVLALSLLITLCASAEAAAHRSKAPRHHLQPDRRVPVPQGHVPGGFAVPGWTDEETRQWLNSASGPKG
jgi:hypothetical protein